MNGCETLEVLDSALGPPLARRTLGQRGRFAGAIGRWRHAGAEVDFGGAETLQLLFNISGGQIVEVEGARRAAPVRAGSVTCMDPAVSPKVRVRGEADTLQIVLSRSLIAAAQAATVRQKLSPAQRVRSIQALSVRSLLVLADAASHPSVILPILREAAALALQNTAPATRLGGGLRPSARRRLLALMEERIAGGRPAPLAELADQAGLSLHHFIRAFAISEGRTPHAWLIARQIDEALRRLLEEGAQVGELADAGGFCSPAHFVSTFHRSLGVTPGRLREAARPLPRQASDDKTATS